MLLEIAESVKHIPIDPEADMTVDEIIRYHGYPVENHYIQTKDGYIITVQRIPYGRSGPGTKPRKPVLVQHGMFCTSAVWVSNTADKNLPYLLAEAGYDVWLGNVRGTKFGQNHTTLSPDDHQFWKFSFDEFSLFDAPAIIDTMLNKTGFSQVYYIGQSLGTSMSFAMLSSLPKYNQIVRTSFNLAPVARVDHLRVIALRLAAPFSKELALLLDLFGMEDKVPLPVFLKLVKLLGRTVCISPLKFACEIVVGSAFGFDTAQLNTTRAPVYMAHTPGMSSRQNAIHLSQLYLSKKFQKHDYGKEENLRRYNQTTPPEYDLSKITTQVALFWGDNDYLADPEDVDWLSHQLKNMVLKYRVPYKNFNHMDFILAIDVKSLLYDKLIDVMRKLWPEQ